MFMKRIILMYAAMIIGKLWEKFMVGRSKLLSVRQDGTWCRVLKGAR